MENNEKRKEFQIKMGDYEVYESGSVTSVKGDPIEFVFSGFSVKIFFEFAENTSK